jgi:hypothetical protein
MVSCSGLKERALERSRRGEETGERKKEKD